MRRHRGLRRALAIVAALVLLPIASFLIFRYVESARLDRALDAIEARGEPLDLHRLDPVPETDEQRQASRDYAEAVRLAADAAGTRLTSFGRTIEELCASPPGDPGRAERLASLRRFEDIYAAALELLDKATALDAHGWENAGGAMPRQSFDLIIQSRNLASINAVRIARHACGSGGDGDAAASDLLATIRMSRVMPSSNLTSSTAHGLQSMLTWTTPSEGSLHRLQDAYASLVMGRTLERSLFGARARMLDVMFPGEFSDAPPELLRVSPPQLVANWFVRPFRERAVRAELTEFDEALAAARVRWPQAYDALMALPRKYGTTRAASPRRPGTLQLMIRPFGRHVAAAQVDFYVPRLAESMAGARASEAALAVARYRRAHAGALPAALSDLVPSYLSSVPLDPYTGRELIYRVDGGKYKVYTVGLNRQDDGGVWDQHSDLQYARRGDPKDIGIAVGAWPAVR